MTRPAGQSAELAQALEEVGAHVLICPLIRIEPFAEVEAARRVLRDFDEFGWVIFTSANGVDQFMRLVAEQKPEGVSFRGKQIACVGPATAAAAERYGLTVDAIPGEFVGDAVAGLIGERGEIAGRRVLIARAAGGGKALPAELRAQGALVEDLELYRSVGDPAGAQALDELLSRGDVDVVTFTSGSAVRYFVESVEIPGKLRVAVIGPSTADVARSCGLRVDIQGNPYTIAGLVGAIVEYYAASAAKERSDAGE